jgi:hypothetical protein
MADTEHTVPDVHTHEEDEKDGAAAHVADRAPTADEEAEADEEAASGVDESVAEHERDMARRGANVKGEGRIS